MKKDNAGRRLRCRFLFVLLTAGMGMSCSTTKHLPPGEILYTGIRKTEVTDEDYSESGDEAMTEVEAALACPPNNALFGSSTVRIPFPFGLWMYNAFMDKPGKLSQWMFRNFASMPVLLSSVNPDLRTNIAQNILREHGYFNATATYEAIPHAKDSMKAKIHYRLTMNEPYTYDSIEYRRMQLRTDTLLKLSTGDRLIHVGDQFNVIRLEAERQRIASLMRDNGYYYFRPDYITYSADSTLTPRKVGLRVGLAQDVSPVALRSWKVGEMSVRLFGYSNEPPTDSVHYKELTIYYPGKKLLVRPKELYNRFRFKPGELYSQTKQAQTQNGLNHLGIFRYTDMQYSPRSDSRRCDTLNVNVNATYDLPLDEEMEVNFTANSNKRIGPGAVFSLTKNNLFGGGESLALSLNGTYEWLLGEKRVAASLTDNYEYGATGTFNFPRVLLPDFFKREYDFSASTTYQLYANRLNRAEFFRILSFGGSATYDFVPNPIRHHSFTPFRLSFNRLERTTERFDSIAGNNRALFQSFRNQFVPAVSYTYVLDNAPVRKGRHTTWWQLSVTESGNLISSAYALAGTGFDEPKKLLGNPFSQFLKLTTELRYNHVLNRNHRIVGRLGGGVIYSYGNSTASPYSEQFYVGGANSIRAFTIRSVGPGRLRPDMENSFANLDHTGDLKLEANLEYRFSLVGDLEGAMFLDSGNVWLLRDDGDNNRSGGTFEWSHFPNDIAVGTGAGIRYNFEVLVIRLDVGVALHVPYDTGRSGYFNKTKGDGFGFHIAVGYPF
ncbi:MAG: BamA/TamA family outer membrane protein [Tannerella sp.]|jgi:outer membrane protein assembly factor BamA|nr:BamA/TamA family outer membrane protein [Tannerella sp.]